MSEPHWSDEEDVRSRPDPRWKCLFPAAVLSLLLGCGGPSPAPLKALPHSATTTAPVASVTAQATSGPKIRRLFPLDALTKVETLFRGELGGNPVIFWVRSLPGAPGDHYNLAGRYHFDSDGEDIAFQGTTDQDGHLSLETDGGGSLTEESGVDLDMTNPAAGKLIFRGVLRRGAQESKLHVSQVVSRDPNATSAVIVHRKLHREEHKGTSDRCAVDVDYLEILEGLPAHRLEELNHHLSPFHGAWAGKCVTGIEQSGEDIVAANEAGVLSIRSMRKESGGEVQTRFYTRLVPSGDEVKLDDVLQYSPGTSELVDLLKPAFAKALGGDRKKAWALLDRFGLSTKDPVEPAACLLTPKSAHFVWAEPHLPDPGPFPAPEGAVLDYATLRKKNALNVSGRLASFLEGK